MFSLILTVVIITSLLLMLVVLAQNPKGGGLSSQFGGSGASQLIGVKKTGDILEKLTWGLAIALLVFSLSTEFLISKAPNDTGNANFDEAANTPGSVIPDNSPALTPEENSDSL